MAIRGVIFDVEAAGLVGLKTLMVGEDIDAAMAELDVMLATS